MQTRSWLEGISRSKIDCLSFLTSWVVAVNFFWHYFASKMLWYVHHMSLYYLALFIFHIRLCLGRNRWFLLAH
uniref:Uncharacterized protein n=1 Tax=Manihot esculenta TaxID=3983 RepID=A0A2C9VFY5_MANES